jgi:type IV pilus secretin PilQ/predicted competence protein
MTRNRGLTLLVALATTGAIVNASSGPAERASTVSGARLKTISTRVDAKGAALVIEASDPVAYVATRPDPLTVVLDLRNVNAEGVTNGVAVDGRSPITSVSIDPPDATQTSRVRVSLSQPVAHRVHSDRNTIVLQFEKPSPNSVAAVAPPLRQGQLDAARAVAVDPLAALGLQNGATASAASVAANVLTAPRLQNTADGQAIPRGVQSGLPQGGVPTTSTGTTPPQPATSTIQTSGGTVQGAAVAPGSQQRRYTGHPISLDFQGADLRAVLRTFAEISSLNIVIDPAINGTVDVALRDVPWDQALDIILRANKLGYIVDGTIVRIAPLNVLADEETQRRKLGEEQALAGTLEVLTKRLSYAKAEELSALITKSALSARGTVQVDPRTNTLILTDLPDRLTLASDLIGTLDQPQPQVEIEARIVQANKNYARQLGIQWGFNGKMDPTLGNTTNLAFPNSVAVGGGLGTQSSGGSTTATNTAVNLPAPGRNSAVGLALGSVNGAFNLDFALSAAETSGNLRVLSSPRVSAQNNGEAEITQGVQIPIQTVSNNTTTVSFRDAALTLKVTPQITAAGTVIMRIQLENASPDFSRSVNGIPPINTQRANTQVLVVDGQTTVIGGIFTSQEQALNDRTPGLGQVPLLKWLFKRDQVSDQSTELLIFITPRIIKT